eukprot:5676295-Prymnesium_polylepis.1
MSANKVAFLVLVACATVAEGQLCEPFCTEPCTVLNGDVEYECGACDLSLIHISEPTRRS